MDTEHGAQSRAATGKYVSLHLLQFCSICIYLFNRFSNMNSSVLQTYNEATSYAQVLIIRSKKMETLSSDIEKVARKILQILHENCPRKSMNGNDMMQRQDLIGSVCCLYKHGRNFLADQWAGSLGYDVMRMLIRGTDYSHALCLHICDGSSEFHVYSKKGWVSFCPDKDALIVTVGDRAQVWSGGQYKHVFGWPIFKGEDKDSISMAFLYSPPSSNSSSSKTSKGKKTVSLGQQAIVAVILTLVCHFLVYFYKEV